MVEGRVHSNVDNPITTSLPNKEAKSADSLAGRNLDCTRCRSLDKFKSLIRQYHGKIKLGVLAIALIAACAYLLIYTLKPYSSIENMPDSELDLTQQDGTSPHVLLIRSYTEYQAKLKMCSEYASAIKMVILSDSVEGWPLEFEPLCPIGIKEISIQGKLHSQTLLNLLLGYHFTLENIDLKFDSDVHSSRADWKSVVPAFRKLQKLSVACSSCDNVYRILSRLRFYSTITNLKIYDANTTLKSGAHIKTILLRSYRLTDLHLTLHGKHEYDIFDGLKLSQLTKLEIDAPLAATKRRGWAGTNYVNLCSKFKRLSSIESKDWRLHISSLQSCQFLNTLKLQVADPEKYGLENAHYLARYLPRLRVLYLDFKHSIPSNCPNYVGFEKLRLKRTLVSGRIRSPSCPLARKPRPFNRIEWEN